MRKREKRARTGTERITEHGVLYRAVTDTSILDDDRVVQAMTFPSPRERTHRRGWNRSRQM